MSLAHLLVWRGDANGTAGVKHMSMINAENVSSLAVQLAMSLIIRLAHNKGSHNDNTQGGTK
jgi:hypothetical protein